MRAVAAALVLAAILLAVRLTAPIDLMSGDQGKSAQYVLYAWQTGEILAPLEKGESLPTKQPLPTWIGLLAARIAGGPSAAALQASSAVLGLVLVLLTTLLARRLVPHPVPLIAGLVTAANYLFLKTATVVRPDMALAVSVAAAIYAAARAVEGGGRAWAVLCFLFLGLGVLAKGPVAILIAALAVVPWRLLAGDRGFLRRLSPLSGLALLIAVVAAWAVPAYLERGSALVEVMVVDELSRHAGGGRQPVYTYLFTFPGRFLPWVIFLPTGLVIAWRSRREAAGWPLGLPFGWFVFAFVALSFFGSKRADYLLPIVPAASILVAVSLVRSTRTLSVLVLSMGIALLAGLAVVLVLGPDGVADLIPKRRPRTAALAEILREKHLLLAGALAAGAALATFSHRAVRRGRSALAAVSLFAIFLTGTAVVYHGMPELTGEYRTTPDFAERALEEARSRNSPLLVHGIRSGAGANGLLFYLGRAEPLAEAEEVDEAVAEHGVVLVVTMPKAAAGLEARGLATSVLFEAVQERGKVVYLLLTVRKQ